MKTYPIQVPRKRYRGSNITLSDKAAEYNRDAAKLEQYLNDRIRSDPGPIQQYLYGFIASEVGLAVERVRDILFGVDCGHNGLTVARSPEAWRRFIDGDDAGPGGA